MKAYWQVDRQAGRNRQAGQVQRDKPMHEVQINIAAEESKEMNNMKGLSLENNHWKVQNNIDDLAEDKGSGSVYMCEWLIGESGNR